VSGAAEPAPVSLPLELRPYRARISVGFADDPQFPAAFCQTVLTETAEAADRCLGEMWSLETDENRWMLPASAVGLERLGPEAVRGLPAAQGQDKLFLLVVEPQGAFLRLAGREWDAASQQLGPVRTRVVAQRRELAAQLYVLAYELFRPVVALDLDDRATVAVRVQAGELRPSDPDRTQLRAGQLWQPLYRHLDKSGAVERAQIIPWTYLRTAAVPQESAGTRAECEVITGLRSPLTARRRARIEPLAIALAPVPQSTELRLVSNRSSHRPLVGYDVDVVTAADSPPQRLLSDRSGAVSIPADPRHPQVWLVVHSGQALLARLPFVPGVQAEQSVELPDDAIRLAVDGELAVLQAKLMDTVVRRALVVVQSKRLAQAGNWKEVEALRAGLKELPGTEIFKTELNAIRIPAVKAAREQKDSVMVSRIEKLCDETRDLVLRYLDDDKLRALDEELVELKKLAEDDANLL
jgi:hypothetical protein